MSATDSEGVYKFKRGCRQFSVTGLNIYSLLVAVIGAVLVLVIYHALRRA